MPKTFYEVYKPKSPDEQKFVDKHITVKHADRNGNGDDLFNAKNIKKVKRSKEGHGYESGEDAKVYEDLEAIEASLLEYFDEIGQEVSYEELQELAVGLQGEVLDELSKPLLGRYVRGAATSKANAAFAQGFSKDGSELNKKGGKVEDKRTRGIDKALDRLTNNRYGVKEETQLDELSKPLLGRYVKAAASGITHNDSVGSYMYQAGRLMPAQYADEREAGNKSFKKAHKRAASVSKAVDRLTKENLDNIINRYNQEEISLEEAVLEKIAHLSEKHQSLIITLFDTLSEDNQELLFQTLDDEDGINETIDFALDAELNESASRANNPAFRDAQKNAENLRKGIKPVKQKTVTTYAEFQRHYDAQHKEAYKEHKKHYEFHKSELKDLHHMDHDLKSGNLGIDPNNKEHQRGAEEEIESMKDKHRAKVEHHLKKMHYHNDQLSKPYKIKEDVDFSGETLNELSRNTVRSYYNKAGEEGMQAQSKYALGGGDWTKDGSLTKTLRKRAAGRKMALKRRNGHIKMSEETLNESPIAGTRKISSHEGKDGHTHEIRYDRDNEEYSVHHYKDGKHLGEGPVSYHSDKEEAKDQVAYDVKNFKR